MTTFTMKAPAAYAAFQARSGTQYVASSSGTISNVALGDLESLIDAGCTLLAPSQAASQQLRLLEFKAADGTTLGAAAATKLGLSSTPGTVLSLVSESANNNTKADIAVCETILGSWYTPGSAINVAIPESIAGAGTLSVKNLTVTGWVLNADGTQTALTISAAQALVAAATTLNFTISNNAALVPGARILLKLLVDLTETASSGMVASLFAVTLS